MNYNFIKTILRRFVRHPRVYAYLRRTMLLGQYLARIPDDPDFTAFKRLNGRENGLIIDVGANGGQAAIAFSFLLPKFDIVSFEPNPALWQDLDFVARVIGKRFTHRKIGLGSNTGSMTLFVPQVGGLPITTLASLDRDAADKRRSNLENAHGQIIEIQETKVEIATFDSLDLHPDAIKIDVEGFELQVLQGMTTTLKNDRPILMLENNANNRACMDLLADMDYQILYFDTNTRRMTNTPGQRAVNWFAVPSDQVKQFSS